MCHIRPKIRLYLIKSTHRTWEELFYPEKSCLFGKTVMLKGGGVMSKDSKRARIQAAREWLGQADASLGQSDELQGDLKLMLAKAELEGASPGRAACRLRRWLFRGAALSVAVLIVLALAVWNPVREPAKEPSLPVVQKEASAPQAKQENPQPIEEPAPAEDRAALGGETPDTAPAPAVQENTADKEGPFEAGTPQSAASPHLTYAPPRVPDSDKQKLMQEAGAVLRR